MGNAVSEGKLWVTLHLAVRDGNSDELQSWEECRFFVDTGYQGCLLLRRDRAERLQTTKVIEWGPRLRAANGGVIFAETHIVKIRQNPDEHFGEEELTLHVVGNDFSDIPVAGMKFLMPQAACFVRARCGL